MWYENGLVKLLQLLFKRRPDLAVEAVVPVLNRMSDLDQMKMDLDAQTRELQFEHLAGLFTSNSFNHGVSGLTFRMAAYTFGLIRSMKAKKIIEIGRYKGGTAFLMAAAMGAGGKLWTVDIGEKESRLHRGNNHRSFDLQLREMCARFGFDVQIVVGDSRVVQCDAQEVDLVFIDGEHTYDAVKNDFERFGCRVRVGGAILFDDCSGESTFVKRQAYMEKFMAELKANPAFRLVKTVDRLGHYERVQNDISK